MCGKCSALVNIQDYGSSCAVFCAAQGLTCVDAWDDIVDETCSRSAEKLGCSHIWNGFTDVICMCGPPGEGYISRCHQFHFSKIITFLKFNLKNNFFLLFIRRIFGLYIVHRRV